MAYISITGYNEHLSTNETIEAVDFFGKILLGRLYKHIDIDIEFKRLKGFWGQCGILTLDNNKCRDFVIYVNSKLCKRNQIRTLAHEMVHVKQFARGEFIYDTDNCKWKNRNVNIKGIDYKDYPWEKEAYRLETELYNLYMEQH